MLRLLPTYRNESSPFRWAMFVLKTWVLLWILWVSLECGPRQKVIGI